LLDQAGQPVEPSNGIAEHQSFTTIGRHGISSVDDIIPGLPAVGPAVVLVGVYYGIPADRDDLLSTSIEQALFKYLHLDSPARLFEEPESNQKSHETEEQQSNNQIGRR